MTKQQQIKQMLQQMEAIIQNIKEVSKTALPQSECDVIVDLEISISNAFRCVERKRNND